MTNPNISQLAYLVQLIMNCLYKPQKHILVQCAPLQWKIIYILKLIKQSTIFTVLYTIFGSKGNPYFSF